VRFSGLAGIVTGASTGIGLAIAERLAGEGAALCLIAAPSDAEELDAVTERLGGRAFGIAADIGAERTAQSAISETLERFGRIDLLASNAGIAPFGPALRVPITDFDATYHVNVRGMFLIAQAAAREMSREAGGAIVCTGSSDGLFGHEGQVAYNASKAAVTQMVRSLSLDLAPHGVRINGVAPGWVRTRATAGAIEDPMEWSRHRSRIPMDRPATPAEIAAVVAFLLSADASYMTGAIVPCDGGLTAGFRTSDWDVNLNPTCIPREARPYAPDQ